MRCIEAPILTYFTYFVEVARVGHHHRKRRVLREWKASIRHLRALPGSLYQASLPGALVAHQEGGQLVL